MVKLAQAYGAIEDSIEAQGRFGLTPDLRNQLDHLGLGLRQDRSDGTAVEQRFWASGENGSIALVYTMIPTGKHLQHSFYLDRREDGKSVGHRSWNLEGQMIADLDQPRSSDELEDAIPW